MLEVLLFTTNKNTYEGTKDSFTPELSLWTSGHSKMLTREEKHLSEENTYILSKRFR